MRIKNIDKIKSLIKKKLPQYLEELGCKIERNKLQCPISEEHTNQDLGKLSAAFLPDSNNTLIFCFVHQKTYDIFNIYAHKTHQSVEGKNFYKILKELAVKYNIEIEEEYEYSAKEKELYRQRLFLENLHKLAYTKQQIKKGSKYLKARRLDITTIKEWKIGYLDTEDITPAINKECKNLFNYRLLSVFHSGGIIIPVFDEDHQYSGIIIRMCDTDDDNPYIKVCLHGSNLFNIEKVKGREELTIVEGIFDVTSLYPKQNVIACLTNFVNDSNLDKIAKMDMKKIYLALDPDNLYKGTSRDGFLRTILRMKNIDTEITVTKIPESEDLKLDPDEYMKNHTLDDFNNLVKISAIHYLLENYKRGLIKAEIIYDFISGCPNIIRKEHFINECAKALEIGKKQLTKSIEDISENKTSFNMIQFVQEKEAYDELLEEFTESAWNKSYKGMASSFPLFDKKFGGFEDTLYLFIAFPEMGKTSALLNFAYNLANNNNNFVAFYSLDDGAKRSILPRLMSIASNLKSKEIREPEKLFEKEWFTGMNKLKSFKDNLVIKDGADIRTLDDLDNFVKIHSTIASEKNKKFIIIIDNLHDLQASKYKALEATSNAQRIASYLKRLPQHMNCPIIATAEVPKSASNKPSGKDIKESIDLWYAARFVGGIYSNFHHVKNKEESNLHWKDDKGKYHPIMELFVSKNQTGEAEHGSLFYKFNFNNNTLIECTEQETEILKDGGFLTFMEE